MHPMFLGAVIALVVVLGAVAVALLARARRHGARERAARDALARHNQDAHEQRLKSLEMITLAALTGDCELSEACLRVRAVLRDYPGLRTAPEFAPIEDLYDEIRHLDVGDARRSLSRAELERQDEARRVIEGNHRAAVLGAFRTLRERAGQLSGTRFDIAVATGAEED